MSFFCQSDMRRKNGIHVGFWSNKVFRKLSLHFSPFPITYFSILVSMVVMRPTAIICNVSSDVTVPIWIRMIRRMKKRRPTTNEVTMAQKSIWAHASYLVGMKRNIHRSVCTKLCTRQLWRRQKAGEDNSESSRLPSELRFLMLSQKQLDQLPRIAVSSIQSTME